MNNNNSRTFSGRFFPMKKNEFHFAVKDEFIVPDLIAEIPELESFCTERKDNGVFEDYHCRNLDRVLFRCANELRHSENTYFRKVSRGVIDMPIREEISYHVKELMEGKSNFSDIILMGEKIESVCDKYSTTNIQVHSTTPEDSQ